MTAISEEMVTEVAKAILREIRGRDFDTDLERDWLDTKSAAQAAIEAVLSSLEAAGYEIRKKDALSEPRVTQWADGGSGSSAPETIPEMLSPAPQRKG